MGTITRISVAGGGTEANANSYEPEISSDGRYVVFNSDASNLVTGDTNAVSDIFLRDTAGTATTADDTITRLSVNSGGTEGSDDSNLSDISADGRYVTFESDATNLVTGDTNAKADIFLRDTMGTATTADDTITRISVAADGTQASSNVRSATISANGRYVVFQSDASNLVTGDTNGRFDIFLRDTNSTATTADDTITRVSVAGDGTQGTHQSSNAAVSSDGRYVVFQSQASNLVTGDSGGTSDIFWRDTAGTAATADDTLLRLSIASDGTGGNNLSSAPTISSDGRYVVFSSDASNLVTGDTNGIRDIFLVDTSGTATTADDTLTRISVASDGTQSNGASNLPVLSENGRYVVFVSTGSNLVTDDTNGVADIFLRDTGGTATTADDTMLRISLAGDGTQANALSNSPEIGLDGRYVVFLSSATNLVAGDSTTANDIFLLDTGLGVSSGGGTTPTTSGGGEDPGTPSGGTGGTSGGGNLPAPPVVTSGPGGPAPTITTTTTSDPGRGGTVQVNTIAPVDAGSANPVTIDLGGGGGSFTASVPGGIGMAVEQPSGTQTAGTASTFLGGTIGSVVADPGTADTMQTALDSFLGTLPSSTTVQTMALTPTLGGGVTPGGTLTISGAAGQTEAVVLDMSGVGTGATVVLDNVEFASVVGDAVIRGGAGSNYVVGDGGNQNIILGEGDDTLFGSGGNDLIGSEAGSDQLYGNTGQDTVQGGAENDSAFGGQDADQVSGQSGDDRVYGNKGDDQVFGGTGNDSVYGGQGDDTVRGGDGDDALFGNLGADTFVVTSNAGADTIADFAAGEDVIQLSEFGFTSYADIEGRIFDVGGNAVIDLDGRGSSITLTGTAPASLAARDFAFG